MARREALACCVDLPPRGMDGEARLLPGALPQSFPAARKERPWAPRFSSGASPRSELGSTSSARRRGAPRIDVGSDARGEFFDVRFAGGGRRSSWRWSTSSRADRHLLLLVRDGGEKSKFLCGHDERHWFVAAVPEDARGVTGVAAAKAALQPELVRDGGRPDTAEGSAPPSQRRVRPPGRVVLRPGARSSTRRPALVLRNEPLSRGRGKAHMIELALSPRRPASSGSNRVIRAGSARRATAG